MSILSTIFSSSRIVNNDRTSSSVLRSLTSELGELAQEIDIKEGTSYKQPDEEGIIGEAIDVIVSAADIIYLEDPDITEEQILQILKKKCDKWVIKEQEHVETLNSEDEEFIKEYHKVADIAFQKTTSDWDNRISYLQFEFNDDLKVWKNITLYLAGRNPFVEMTSEDIVWFLGTKHMKWCDCYDYSGFVEYFERNIVSNGNELMTDLQNRKILPQRCRITKSKDGSFTMCYKKD